MQTPKGDENVKYIFINIPHNYQIRNANPERGRKQKRMRHTWAGPKRIRNANPERGRKLIIFFIASILD